MIVIKNITFFLVFFLGGEGDTRKKKSKEEDYPKSTTLETDSNLLYACV